MPLQGAVAARAQALIPITWNALENDSRVGDSALQSAIDLAKENTTGQLVAPADEDLYPVVVVDYIAKLAVIEICRTAVDFWMNQAMSISTTGTNESASYVDRADEISKLQQQLIQETREAQTRVSKVVGYWIDNGRAVPQLSSATINPFHLTPSPEEFPRPYRQTPYS